MIAKRIFDIGAAFLGMIVLSPLLLVVAALIRLHDRGPALYRGERVGRGGKRFFILKFRSMVLDADRIGGSCTSSDDPRITRLGRWLRKYKIDELPQLINVLRGEMSLVGPRPDTADFTARLAPEKAAIIFSIRPGITDLATLWNPNEEAFLAGRPDPENAYLEFIWPRKTELQIEYVRRRSFLLDLKILFETLAAMVTRRRTEADVLSKAKWPSAEGPAGHAPAADERA